MYNRKTEARSQSILNLATHPHPFPIESSFSLVPYVDTSLLKLYDLFAEEERLAALIATDDQPVDRTTILKTVAMAEELAFRGYSTSLVPTDEMLDIAQTFAYLDPHTARLSQDRTRQHPNDFFGHRATNENVIGYRVSYRTGPDVVTANTILADILNRLCEKNNPAWTARVAAALAYFSALKAVQNNTDTV